jgi:dephospho-CoA kinase
MKRILLTGMSGTGKSTVASALSERGYKAINLDHPDWSVHDADGEWIWREDRVRKLLSVEDADVLFVSGCAENQMQFHPQFDHIILLSASKDVIIERLATRTNNPYGKKPEEFADVLRYVETIEPRLRRVASHEIDTSAPLEDVLEEVLRIAGRSQDCRVMRL